MAIRRSRWTPVEAADAQDVATALHLSQARAMRSVVRPDGTLGAEPMDIDKIPELAALSGLNTYLWLRDLGVRLADVPADVRV